MIHIELFEKFNRELFVPHGASLKYDGTIAGSSHFTITDRNGIIHKHEFDPNLNEEEIESMLELLSQGLLS